MTDNNGIFNKIARALLIDYTSVYYVDAVTNEYQWYSVSSEYHSLKLEQGGDDFFRNIIRDAEQVVYEEDKHIFTEDIQKDRLLAEMKSGSMQNIEYRLVIDGKPVYHTLRLIRNIDGNNDYFILGVLNIDKEVRSRQAAEKLRREREIFNQIAESMAENYDDIFYVNSITGNFLELSPGKSGSGFSSPERQSDFFGFASERIYNEVHPDDKENMFVLFEKENLIRALDSKHQYSSDYRIFRRRSYHHCRVTMMWSRDRVHFIVGIENIDEEVRLEKERARAISTANELARRDELTGTKNKTAYHELEMTIQGNIDIGVDYFPFAIVVCDINGLKYINDTKGHKAGDDYIRECSRLICNTFSHSPVFRIGGDEFAVLLSSGDYAEKDELFKKFRDTVITNAIRKSGPVIASGIASYNKETDTLVADVFERADTMMYENKSYIKEGNFAGVITEELSPGQTIPDERRKKLDSLFTAFSLVAEGTYVYLCDMKYDCSRWSRTAVDTFGLPSEYMYGAGNIWEEHIHPDDRESYRSGIQEIFSGRSGDHDMQYRARRANGEYNVCTCRGIVLKDENGEPEYFGGAIRNNGAQGSIDILTGLPNQYAFFEQIQNYMDTNTVCRICMIGIGKFSEINTMYGYHFGNIILQKFARYLFEKVGNSGSVFRLDGTKFAVISITDSPGDLIFKYKFLREHFRKGFTIDEKNIILDLSAGLLTADNFNVDHQTVYTCLNFAYGESKVRRQGDIVEFYNDLNDENKHRIEKLHAVRDSIMEDYRGFYLMYQPVVDAKTEKLIGAEALLRWKSTEYGTVPPDLFIPILEKDPLFCGLGHWILKKAVTNAKQIMKLNPDFIVNVNLSYTQLEKPDFVDMVYRTLSDAAFPPEHLCLEITERCRLLDMSLLKNIIVNLRGQGIKIALDDFGTGFSSVGVVKNLPFDIIKIDRSFVRRIEEDQKERELIRAFADVASTFGAKVCVEGIETAVMRDILQRYRVQSFQGYYYAKPLEFNDFMTLFSDGGKHNIK